MYSVQRPSSAVYIFYIYNTHNIFYLFYIILVYVSFLQSDVTARQQAFPDALALHMHGALQMVLPF